MAYVSAKTSFELSMALIDEITKQGTVDYNKSADYSSKAPRIMTILQLELANIEGIDLLSPEITDLENDVLEVSDYAALRVLPYGMAYHFIGIDDSNTALASEYKRKYEEGKGELSQGELETTDVYNLMSGLM